MITDEGVTVLACVDARLNVYGLLGLTEVGLTEGGSPTRSEPDAYQVKPRRPAGLTTVSRCPAGRRQASMWSRSTSAALPMMNSRRGPTSLPMRRLKMCSASSTSSILTRRRTR